MLALDTSILQSPFIKGISTVRLRILWAVSSLQSPITLTKAPLLSGVIELRWQGPEPLLNTTMEDLLSM